MPGASPDPFQQHRGSQLTSTRDRALLSSTTPFLVSHCCCVVVHIHIFHFECYRQSQLILEHSQGSHVENSVMDQNEVHNEPVAVVLDVSWTMELQLLFLTNGFANWRIRMMLWANTYDISISDFSRLIHKAMLIQHWDIHLRMCSCIQFWNELT